MAAAAEADEVASQDKKTDKDTKESKKGKDAGKSEKDKQEVKADDNANQSVMGNTLMNDTSVVSITKLPDRDNIDNDFKPVIIKLW